MAAAKKERIVDILEEISTIHSPTGFTHNVLTHIEKMLKKAGITTRYTNKGALIAGNHAKPEIAVAGHIDRFTRQLRHYADTTLAGSAEDCPDAAPVPATDRKS